MNSRKLHIMCAVWDNLYYEKRFKGKPEVMDRYMFSNKRTDIGYTEGFYIFGGMDEANFLHNDLWLVRPNYKEN